MSIIHSLNLNEGGGIIPDNDVSRPEDTPSILIGVGGTGVAALKSLKAKVFNQLKPTNSADKSDKREYSMIRFLALDTDKTSVGEADSDFHLQRDEFQDISVPNLGKLLDPQDPNGRTALKKRPDLNNWMSIDQIEPLLGEAGAGGIRQMGRFMLMQNISEVYTAIKNAITQARTGAAAGGQVNVHIMAGISGGTGSGCFIDICYLVRSVLDSLGVKNGKIFGYFFLPDVVISKPAVRNIPTKESSNRRNGYAAFRELDYLMDLATADDWFDQSYQNGLTIHTQKPPVDLCHLISASDAEGNIPENAFDYSINVVSDYIMAYLAHVKVPKGVVAGQDQGLTMQGHLSNIVNGVNAVQRNAGANYCYTILGASNAEVPFSQIATYLAQGYYKKVSDISRHIPTENEVTTFAEGENLAWDKLCTELTKNASDAGVLANELAGVDMRDCLRSEIKTGQDHPASLLNPAEAWLAEFKGKVESNFSALSTPLSSYEEPVLGQNNSIISSVHRNLMGMCRNKDGAHGAKFAAELLSRNGFDMNAVIAGLIEENKEQLSQERAQQDYLFSGLREARDDFFNASIVTRSFKWNKYRDAMVRWMDHRAKIFLMEKIDVLLQTLKTQLSTLYTEFYHKLDSLCDNLKETFEANAAFLSNPNSVASSNPYTWRIIELRDIKEQELDPVIQRIDPVVATGALMEHLLMSENQDEWLSGSDYRIGRLITKFMKEKFDPQLTTSLEDFIKGKYPGLQPGQIQDKIESNFLTPSHKKATPMFWMDGSYVLANDSYPSSTMTVPSASPLITAAANHFSNGGAGSTFGYSIRPSDISDRIFTLRFNSGLPLYAYQGVTLMRGDYAKDLQAGTAGLHLYEHNCVLEAKECKTPEDLEIIASTAWGSYLPSPIPLSRTYTEREEHSEQHKALEELFKRAKGLGVIGRDSNNSWVIFDNPWNEAHKLPCLEDYVDHKTGKFNEGQADAEMRACDEILAKWTAPELCRQHALLGNVKVKDGFETAVLLDRFIRYPRLVAVVRRNLGNYDFLQQKKAALGKLIEEQNNLQFMLEDFAKSLFMKVLKRGIGCITFTDVVYGIQQDTRLDDPNDRLSNIFLHYKAFSGFKKLTTGQYATIKSDTDTALNRLNTAGPDSGEVKAALNDLNTLRRELRDIFPSVLQQTSTMPKAQGDEITNFYHALRNELSNMCWAYFMGQFVPDERL